MSIDVKNLSDEQKTALELARAVHKKKYGMTDEEWEKHISEPCSVKIILSRDTMAKYRIVAECVESKFCGAGIKVGQKFKFQTIPNLYLPEESDAPPCIKALGPLSELMHGLWERMFEGLDPNEGMGQYAGCLDMGVEYGGLGHVVFKLYCEKI